MARLLVQDDGCGRCGGGKTPPREVSDLEMSDIIEEMRKPEGEKQLEGIEIRLGSAFHFGDVGGTAKYENKVIKLGKMCDDCLGTVLDNVVSIERKKGLTREENPHRRKRKKADAEEPASD